ncbi:hypothetical protein BDW22DRAFT_1484438 [Trametopsis cervina]|nr:hypothetical protein BDW22DRAFT_1484438 [Trametopsis cervina]
MKDREERLADGLRVFTHTSDGFPRSPASDLQRRNSASSRGTPEAVAPKLGIQENFRMKIVQWMLDVLPPALKSKPQLCINLRAQLLESADTRWHAAHMFTRYFLRVGVSTTSPTPISEESRVKREEGGSSERVLHGKEALTWDLAVAAVALAVKFHRDVLKPLYPVTAREFLLIAPHSIEYDDLEAAQRDLFSALSHCLGSNTPAAYIDELWNALPSLRSLVTSRGNWEVTKFETWELLYDTLLDSSYLLYPVHVLTGCAVILGLIESLVMTMKADTAEKLRKLANGIGPRTKRREAACTCTKLQKKARKLVRNVELDMCELLDVPGTLWTECMNWLEAVAEENY